MINQVEPSLTLTSLVSKPRHFREAWNTVPLSITSSSTAQQDKALSEVQLAWDEGWKGTPDEFHISFSLLS